MSWLASATAALGSLSPMSRWMLSGLMPRGRNKFSHASRKLLAGSVGSTQRSSAEKMNVPQSRAGGLGQVRDGGEESLGDASA
jgi:hypothetical protein